MRPPMEITFAVSGLPMPSRGADVLAVGMFAGRGLGAALKALDGRLSRVLQRPASLGDFKAEAGTSTLVYGDRDGGPRRILAVGLGDPRKADLDTLRRAAGVAASRTASLGGRSLCLALHSAWSPRLDPAEVGRALAEGVCFGAYRYDEYMTRKDKAGPARLRVEVVEPEEDTRRSLSRGCSRGALIGRACNLARDVANQPGNAVHPSEMAALARRVARSARHLSCTVLGGGLLKARGMGGILAVGAGSSHGPCLIVLRYAPRKRPRGRPHRVALVGKAITFDSGGISIKPSADMDQMKFDKSGGAAVLGTMKAVADLGLDLDVLGLIPAAENLPSGTSYRPGDIVRTYSGKTVEVLNTDAEGRLILCDALTYAVKQGCDTLVDIATLTGACRVALGRHMAGIMGNEDALVAQLRQAAAQSGEPIWPLPCTDDYADEMKSKIADLKNTASRWGGACTAAAFLRQFVGGKSWAHLDIAGVDVCPAPADAGAQVASGFGVRLLTTFLIHRAGLPRTR